MTARIQPLNVLAHGLLKEHKKTHLLFVADLQARWAEITSAYWSARCVPFRLNAQGVLWLAVVNHAVISALNADKDSLLELLKNHQEKWAGNAPKWTALQELKFTNRAEYFQQWQQTKEIDQQIAQNNEPIVRFLSAAEQDERGSKGNQSASKPVPAVVTSSIEGAVKNAVINNEDASALLPVTPHPFSPPKNETTKPQPELSSQSEMHDEVESVLPTQKKSMTEVQPALSALKDTPAELQHAFARFYEAKQKR